MSFNAVLDERTWRTSFLPAFRGAVEGGTNAFMCSYTSVTLSDSTSKENTTPDCASGYLLNDILRGEWGFQGWVTSDANAVSNIWDTEHLVRTGAEAAIAAITGGCDMELTCCGKPPVYGTLTAAVTAGKVPESVIDTAVSRVLKGRFLVGDLDPPENSPYSQLNETDIYSKGNLQLALEAAQQSIVVLRNSPASEGGLPWSTPLPPGSLLCICGPLGNATLDFMGGYAPHPAPGDIVSPYAAFAAALGKQRVALVEGCVGGVTCETLDPGTSQALAPCTHFALFLGTSAYQGGRRGGEAKNTYNNTAIEREGLDRAGVGLGGLQGDLLQLVASTAAASGARAAANKNKNKPLLVVGCSGGMLDLSQAANDTARVSALVAAPTGGQWAGQAIADIVLGVVPPSGRLTTTWYTPAGIGYIGSIGDYSRERNRTYRGIDPGPGGVDLALFPFGWGLSLTQFSYTSVAPNTTTPAPCDTLSFSLTLTNTGEVLAGVEVPQLYLHVPSASVPVPRVALVNFVKTHPLSPGQSSNFTLTLTPEDNSVLREGDWMPVIEPGPREWWIGGSSSQSRSPGVGGVFTVTGAGPVPLSSCGGVQDVGGSARWPSAPVHAQGSGGDVRRCTFC